ncbi:MAG: hypothetical protein QG675_600 [Patescibacteria group bacterium]|jgi:hypothetical protein|nr:hypothetical protein [Patescibacteria group bacterium]
MNDNPDKSIDICVDINHVWQLDPENELPLKVGKTICAIACMKMLIDYLPPKTDNTIKLSEIRDWLLSKNGQNESGNWIHSKQVEYLKQLGYVSWRRNWNITHNDPQWLIDHEGYDDEQISEFNKQIDVESNTKDLRLAITQDFIEIFHRGSAVIASVRSGFKKEGDFHQVVVNGYKKDNTGQYFYVSDPMLSNEQNLENNKIDIDKFFEHFNHTAIFVLPRHQV